MADSHVAAVVKLLSSLSLSPAMGGISPTPLPADAVYPYVTVQKIGGKELESLGGRSGYYPSMMQINCWDEDYESADLMRETIKNALTPVGSRSYVGPAGSLTISGINHQLDTELYEAKRKVHQCITRYQIVWSN